MKKRIKIINPAPHKKRKRLKKRRLKKRAIIHKNRKPFISKRKAKKRKVTNLMARRKTRRKVARKNPGVTYSKKRSRGRRKSYRRNPADLPGKTTDLLSMGAGAAVGGVAVPWISNVFQLEGMTKYGAQIGFSLLLYWLAKKVLPQAAIPAAAAGIGVTVYQFMSENNVLAGLSGDQLTEADIYNLEQLRNAVPAAQLSAVPFDQIGAVPLEMSGGGGYDSDGFADYY